MNTYLARFGTGATSGHPWELLRAIAEECIQKTFRDHDALCRWLRKEIGKGLDITVDRTAHGATVSLRETKTRLLTFVILT